MHFDDIYACRNTLHLFRDIGARLSRQGRGGGREREREEETQWLGNAVNLKKTRESQRAF